MKDGKRKLAAIIFTDIVRYSALSHVNEKLALELLSEHRELSRPVIAKHAGIEVKTIGDAFLLVFETAFDAVQCAVELQRVHQARNKDQPKSRRIQIRIGVHLGDVVVSEGDVYGDGVNIAARLQYVAKPGSICMSGSVFYQVDHKLDVPIVAKGAQRLKNIKNPVAVYEIDLEAAEAAKTSSAWKRFGSYTLPISRRALRKIAVPVSAALALASGYGIYEAQTGINAADKESRIAVLPFENIGQSASDEYLSDGLTEELITSLSRQDGLRVVARTSVMRYKKQVQSAEQVGKELHVGSLIQGTVRTDGPRVRISVQFINAQTQESRWSQVYEGQLTDIFALQKTIADEVSRDFKGRSPANISQNTPESSPTPNSEAYLLYLKGRHFIAKRTEDGLTKGAELLKQAIALDANFAAAYAAAANAASLRAYYGGSSPESAWQSVFDLAGKALALDPRSTDALLSIAEGKLYFSHDWVSAEEHYRRAIALSPEDPTAHQWYAEFLAYTKRAPESEKELEEALRLAPLSLVAKSAAGNVLYFSGDYERAIRYCLAAQELDPTFMLPYYWAGRAYVQTGKLTEAVTALRKAVELSGGETMMQAALAHALAAKGERAEARRILTELIRISGERYVSPYDFATVYASLHENELALTALEKALASRASHSVMIPTDPVFKDLHAHPRFQALLKTLNL